MGVVVVVVGVVDVVVEAVLVDVGTVVVVDGVVLVVVDDVGAMVVVDGFEVVVDDVGAMVVVVHEVDMVNPTKSMAYKKHIEFIS